VNLLVVDRALAGSSIDDPCPADRDDASEAGGEAVAKRLSSGADAWLTAVSRRWSAELEATSLADLQAWQERPASASPSPP